MKRNKKLIKRLKARNKKNILSVKMSGDCPYVKPKKDFVGIDMDGEHPRVKPVSNKNNEE